MAQSIRIPVELELKNMQSAISSLKSALSGVSKNSGIYTELSREIDKVDKKFKELSATASRPFNSIGNINSFENQFLKLGDRVTEISNSFNNLNFKDLNLSSIPDAEEKFSQLKSKVEEAQNALNSISTNKMKDMLAVDTSGLSQAFNELSKFNKGLLNGNSFEETFANLSAKAAELGSNISNTTAEIERLKNANAQSEAQLGFLDEIKTKLAEFKPGELISFDSLAEKMKTTAQSAGLTPEVLLNMLGLNKEGLYTGTVDQIQKKLSNAIASRASSLSKGIGGNTAKITGLDSSLTGLQNYVNAVTEAQNQLNNLMNNSGTQKQIAEAEQVLKSAEAEYKNFVETLLKTGPAAKNAGNSVNSAGSAMTGMTSKAASARAELDRLNNTANKLSQMKSRLAYFFSFYKVMGTIRRVVNEATQTIRDLDKVMTEISVVTQMTQKDLWAQMETYSAIANEYAVSIKGVYEISQLYYQQGLQTAQVMELTVETLKMAKIAGLDYATATDYMTVAVRGFKLEMTDAQRVTDVYSALAAKTASSTEEIAVAMSKTASSAEAVGSSFESTSAMIATMIAVTREAPENIGSAMKSIISRYGEMTSDPTKLVDSEGEEMSLNRVDKALQSVGISLQDAQGKFRDFDEVILELAKKWDTIDTNAQRYIATIMAGNRQQSRFLALVGNVEEYSKALEIANTSEDASAQQVLKTMDSVESKITNVKTAWQQFYTSMGLENVFKGALDIITQIINNINKMSKFEAITTIFNIFTALKGLVMGIFTGISMEFSRIKNLAQESLKPLQEQQQLKVDDSETKQKFVNLEQELLRILKQELNLDTSSAKAKLEELGINVKGKITEGFNLLQGFDAGKVQQFASQSQNLNLKSGQIFSANEINSFYKGQYSGNVSQIYQELERVFGKEAQNVGIAFKDYTKEYLKSNGLQEINAEHAPKVIEGFINSLQEGAKNIDQTLGQNLRNSLLRAKEEGKLRQSTGNLATWLNEHAAGARVTAMALQSLGAALTTYALTLKDSSESNEEKTKLYSGSGSLLSGAGSAISGALMGARAGVPGMIIGAIAAGAPAIISGITQVIDGLKQTTVEKLANAENELKELQDEETRKKAKSSGYATALTELEHLKDAQYDSAEAAQAYKDKMNTLAESYPELVTSMDSAGNAIIDIQNLEQLLAEARLATAQATSEALEKELQTAELDKKRYDEALEGINSVFSGASNYAIQNQSSRKASKDLSEFKNLEEVYEFGQILSDYSGITKVLDNISNAAYKDGKAQTIELAGKQYKLPDVIRALKQNDQGQFSFDKGLFKGQQELSLEDQNNLFSAIQSLGEINYNDIYTTPEKFETLNEELVKDSQYFEEYIAEKAQILKDSNIEMKDLYLQDNYDNLMSRYEKALEDEKIEGQEEEALMTEIVDFYNIELPNALSTQIETATEAVKKSVSSLSKKYAQEELAELAINDNMYREIQEGYSGIFETIGGKLIENEFKAAKSENSKLTLEDWKKTPEFNSVLDSLTNLDLSAYKSIAEIWDNMGAYDPSEFKNALGQIHGLDSNIIDLIVEFYGDSFDYSRELVYNQIQNSKVAKDNKNLKLLTNDIDTFQAPAELMDDINETIQQADNLYEEGLTARANNLISVADSFYMAATNLSNENYLDARSIIDDLDLTNLEDLTEAKASLEAINTDGQYDDLITSVDQAIKNCSQNIDALAQKIVSETITAIEKIGEVIDGFESGFEAKEALEAYKKLEGYKGLLEGKSFDYFFEYDDALGKWVYTNQGMSDIVAAQAKEIEVSNKAIDDLITKSESEVHDVLGLDAEGYVKTAKDYYDEDTETYSKAWTKLSAEDQAYREWARSVQDQEGLEADVSKEAYIEHLRQQAADGERAAQLMWEQMIYSLGDTLDFEKIVTGAMGDGRNRERAISTIEEMIKANGKNLYDIYGNNLAEQALAALETGHFSDYEKITGDQLSPQEVADLVSSKATALNDAVLKAVEASGTIIDEATYNILNEAGLASHIKWDEQGFGIVTEEAANYVAMIEAIASQGGMILEERNATLATLYEKSLGADKTKTLADLSSKTSLGFSDLADLATTMGVTMDAFFNEDATDIILSGLDYNKFTGDFDVVDFDAYWQAVTGSLDKNTAEYLEARSQWVDKQIEKSNKKGEEAQSELDALLDAKVGDKINVSYLESLVPNIGQYLGTIVDGVATITDGSNLLGLLQYVTQLDAESNILENSVGELRDSIVELIEGWADAIASGLSGELSFSDAESLMSQFGLKDTDFSETKNGLKLSKEAAYELYLQLKQIAPLQSQLVFDSIAESLEEAGSGYEDVSSTMATIAKLNKELANVPVSSERRAELERELAVAEEILRVRSQDPDSFNFMDKDLPTGMQGPENYWNSVGEAYKVMNESAKSGYMEIQDYVNIVNQMEAMAIAAGQEFSIGGMNAAQLIEKGMSSLKNIDGEGVKIAMEGVGIDFANAATDMGLSFDDGIKEVAKSQIKMLDAAIRMLEAMVAMENIDANSDGFLDMGEIFANGKDLSDGWDKDVIEWADNLEDAAGKINIGGKSLLEALATLEPEQIQSALNQLKSIDWTLGDTDIASQIQNVLSAYFPDVDITQGKSVFDILEIPDDADTKAKHFTEWMGKMGLAIEDYNTLMFALDNNANYLKTDGTVFQAIEKMLGLEEGDNRFENLYNQLKNLGYGIQDTIKLWDEIQIEDGQYIYNGKPYSKIEEVLAAREFKEKTGEFSDITLGEDGSTFGVTTNGKLDFITKITPEGEVEYYCSDGQKFSTKDEAVKHEYEVWAAKPENQGSDSLTFEQWQIKNNITVEPTATITNPEKLATATNEAVQNLMDSLNSGNGETIKNAAKEVGIDVTLTESGEVSATDIAKIKELAGIEDKRLNVAVSTTGDLGIIELINSPGPVTKQLSVAVSQSTGTEGEGTGTGTATMTPQNLPVNVQTTTDGVISENADLGVTTLPDITQKIIVETIKKEGESDGETPEEVTQNYSSSFDIDTSGLDTAVSTIAGAVSAVSGNITTLASSITDLGTTTTTGSGTISASASSINVSNGKVGAAVSGAGSRLDTLAQKINNIPTGTKNLSLNVTVSASGAGSGKVTGNYKILKSGNVALAKGTGSALAKGTLMGELGPELVVADGRYFTVGNNGAEFVDLPDDAIVFNHLQTQKLLGSSGGMVGTGKPVTNEKKATSLATGNVSGPAMASASAALTQLRQIRAMWQAMLDATAKDLGSKAGSGGGGGGSGGGGAEDVKAVTGELERWYNLLRQIESLEQHITLEQAKRANMQSGYKHVDSLEKELEMLKKQQKAYEMLGKLQKDYYDKRRADLGKTSYKEIFTYDEHGLMQYVDGENKGLDILAKLNERDANGKLTGHAVNAKKQIEYLRDIVKFDVSILKNNEDGTKAKTEEEMMENFWAGVDGWMEELDGLYDSYHEAITNFEESTEKMNEILQEYIDNQLSVEQKLMQAIQDREQAEIDRIQDEKDALEEAAQSYIDGLSDALSKEQDMYSKNETNAETQKLQRQLAILQRSGGSTSEIKSLQDQIDSRLKDAYFQEQQDQIDAIQQASDNQLEKLQNQIDIMTESLEYQKEHGLLWNEVYEMMNQWTPEQMLQFIEEYTKSYQENSALQNDEDSKETLKELEIYTGKRDLDKREAGWTEYYANAKYDEALKQEHSASAKQAYDEAFVTGGASAGEAAANKVYDKALSDKVAAEEEKKRQEEAAAKEPPKEEPKNQLQFTGGSWQFYTYDKPSGGKKGAIFHGKNKSPKVNLVGESDGRYQIEGKDGDGHYFKNRWITKKYKGKNIWKKYETGGLVDYTGPAWVDGTKSKPEAFLSASDTAMLKSKIFSNSDGSLKSLVAALEKITNDTSRYSGEGNAAIVIENAQVNIQPGVISSDYDARRAGEMALEEMVKIARKTTNRVISR